MMSAGLAYSDDQDVLQPLLAEAVPSVENGLWQSGTRTCGSSSKSLG